MMFEVVYSPNLKPRLILYFLYLRAKNAHSFEVTQDLFALTNNSPTVLFE